MVSTLKMMFYGFQKNSEWHTLAGWSKVFQILYSRSTQGKCTAAVWMHVSLCFVKLTRKKTLDISLFSIFYFKTIKYIYKLVWLNLQVSNLKYKCPYYILLPILSHIQTSSINISNNSWSVTSVKQGTILWIKISELVSSSCWFWYV